MHRMFLSRIFNKMNPTIKPSCDATPSAPRPRVE
jgi:hypothetical protein